MSKLSKDDRAAIQSARAKARKAIIALEDIKGTKQVNAKLMGVILWADNKLNVKPVETAEEQAEALAA